MCGIAGGVLSDGDAASLIEWILKDEQYRGYDSWGMATLTESGNMRLVKRVGPPDEGFKNLDLSEYPGNVSIGHNRWATQGEVSEKNAHPHSGCDPYEFLGVHNGVIENYDTLYNELKEKGHTIHTDVDSELILHLIEDERENGNGKNLSFEQLVALAFRRVEGAFGFAGISVHAPNTLVIARRSSPVLIGFLKNGGYIVASDKAALLPHTDQYTSVGDNEVVVLRPHTNPYTFDLNLNILPRKRPVKLEGSAEENRKDGYPHFMLKEMCEAAEAFRKATSGRALLELGTGRLGGMSDGWSALCAAKRVVIIGAGTSEHAGMLGAQYLRTLAKVKTEVIDASEFVYGDYPLDEDDVLIMISQSGATADVLRAMHIARMRKVTILGFVNKVGSAIAQEIGTGYGTYLHVGPEIGVASTKAFVGQVAVLLLLALSRGRDKGEVSKEEGRRIIEAFFKIPEQLEGIINRREEIRLLAEKYTGGFGSFLFFGREENAVVAYEAALKLKEISYVHAEGLPAGKLKHGFLALVTKVEKGGYPCCFIAPHEGEPEHDELFMKTLTNIKEVRTRHGSVLAIATEGNMLIRKWCDDVIYVPQTHRLLTPFLSTVVLQYFAYYAAVARGLNPDQPRNLAKSVTVE